MRRVFFAISILIGALSSCSQQQTTEVQQENVNVNSTVKVKEIEGRMNFEGRGFVIPEPAIMISTYDAEGTPDVMMAAWGGQCGSNLIALNLGKHKTTDNILLKKAFCISFADEKTLAESDYFGMVSANDVPDKVARAGFTATKSPNIDAPIIDQYPLTLECELVSIDDDYRVVGRIVNMSAEERILDEEGKVDFNKLKPVVFDSSHLTYRSVGDEVGKAWGDGKKFQ